MDLHQLGPFGLGSPCGEYQFKDDLYLPSQCNYRMVDKIFLRRENGDSF